MEREYQLDRIRNIGIIANILRGDHGVALENFNKAMKIYEKHKAVEDQARVAQGAIGDGHRRLPEGQGIGLYRFRGGLRALLLGRVVELKLVRPLTVIVDLGADYRFDPDWVYGQPERFARSIEGARRIANPGCYATGAQLALAPLLVGRYPAPGQRVGVVLSGGNVDPFDLPFAPADFAIQ